MDRKMRDKGALSEVCGSTILLHHEEQLRVSAIERDVQRHSRISEGLARRRCARCSLGALLAATGLVRVASTYTGHYKRRGARISGPLTLTHSGRETSKSTGGHLPQESPVHLEIAGRGSRRDRPRRNPEGGRNVQKARTQAHRLSRMTGAGAAATGRRDEDFGGTKP